MRKIISIVLVAMLANLVCTPSSFAAQNKKKETLAEKVKAGIATLGSGAKAQISVTLKDGRRIKGYISEVHDEDFVVATPTAGSPNTVAYVDVKAIKGKNRSTGSSVSLPARNSLRNGLIAMAVSLTLVLVVVAKSTK
jgi:hypothetical protein